MKVKKERALSNARQSSTRCRLSLSGNAGSIKAMIVRWFSYPDANGALVPVCFEADGRMSD